MKSPQNGLLIGVVGPCAAGKSTLVASLRSKGYIGKHIAQEHSYVKDMWRRITNPDILVFLDVSFEESYQRRKMDWSKADYEEQQSRLSHARQHANIYVDTSAHSIGEVLLIVIDELHKQIP